MSQVYSFNQVAAKLSQLPIIDEDALNAKANKLSKIEVSNQDLSNNLKLAISLLDLTSLESTDTPGDIESLILRADKPVSEIPTLHCAGICIYPDLVPAAKKYRDKLNSNVKIVTVGGNFPHGRVPLEVKLNEISLSLSNGADEIDIVLDRSLFFQGNYKKIFQDIAEIKNLTSSKKALLKVILETGELLTYNNINKASHLAMMAGADFIKTSTGKIPLTSTPASTLVLLNAAQSFYEENNFRVGVKPSGGIKKAIQALGHLQMTAEVCSWEQLSSRYYRFGASSLLEDLIFEFKNLNQGIKFGSDRITENSNNY